MYQGLLVKLNMYMGEVCMFFFGECLFLSLHMVVFT